MKDIIEYQQNMSKIAVKYAILHMKQTVYVLACSLTTYKRNNPN